MAAPVVKYPTKPFVRWWWFSAPITESAIKYELDWLVANGFGGVEIAWVYPLDFRCLGPRWLSKEWQAVVAFAKRCCDRRGMRCDFTFGTMWPFGGSFVAPEDAAKTFDGLSAQRLDQSWEAAHAEPGHIIDHLSRRALKNYAAVMGDALKKALKGGTSALFCDSWEVSTRKIWSDELWGEFESQFGYDLAEYTDSLDEKPDVRYDYRKFISRRVIDEFYRPFTEFCHLLGALSRVQCHGAPTDLLEAYSSVDIPETEALLFPTSFSRVAASAATLASKPVVSCETFTCMYGFPAVHLGREQLADLKLVADSVIANGVNHIIWHGMPFNSEDTKNRFYASVHVGPDSGFATGLPEFNRYLETVCEWLREGRTYTNLAVYFPLEDKRMLDRLPLSILTPGAHHYWEMRYVVPPKEVTGYHPIWISTPFLQQAYVENGSLAVGEIEFAGLCVDCDWLDAEGLEEILRLGNAGLPIIMTKRPKQPGRKRDGAYHDKLDSLLILDNVVDDIGKTPLLPLLAGSDLPLYWARQLEDAILIFIANPKAEEVSYPMELGQALHREKAHRRFTVTAFGKTFDVDLDFRPYQSILLRIGKDGAASLIDIDMAVPEPVTATCTTNQ